MGFDLWSFIFGLMNKKVIICFDHKRSLTSAYYSLKQSNIKSFAFVRELQQFKASLDCIKVRHVHDVQDLIELKFSQLFDMIFIVVDIPMIHEEEDSSLPNFFIIWPRKIWNVSLLMLFYSKKRCPTLLSIEMAAIIEMYLWLRLT